MNEFKIDVDELGNYIYRSSHTICTKIVKDTDKATLKAIQRYCEENDIIPNIISEAKLRLVLELGIAELKKRELKDEVNPYELAAQACLYEITNKLKDGN